MDGPKAANPPTASGLLSKKHPAQARSLQALSATQLQCVFYNGGGGGEPQSFPGTYLSFDLTKSSQLRGCMC